VSRLSVVGADVTINNTHYGDVGDWICWLSNEGKWTSVGICKNKENYRIHGS
jgi:hypothetical protein